MEFDDGFHQVDDDSLTSSTYGSPSRKRDLSEFSSDDEQPPTKRPYATAVGVTVPDVVFPASLHADLNTRRNWIKEGGAVRDLLRHRRATKSGCETPREEEEYTTIALDDFSIYRENNGTHPNVMRPLSDLLTRSGDKSYRFDGIVRLGGIEHRVYGVPFSTLSLDGYGSDAVTSSNKIWIQSPLAAQYNVWYHLERPADEYARYHVPFQWLADFSKHFVAYLDSREDFKAIRLHDFRCLFHSWMEEQYGKNKAFQAWHEMYDYKTDYRTVIAANFDFLWKESVTVQEENRQCFLWKEVDVKALSAVPLQPLKAKNTIVTPYVYDCFSKMYFASAMERRTAVLEVEEASIRRARAFASRANVSDVIADEDALLQSKPFSEKIRPGDVVQLEKDQDSPWGGPAEWYAYVQGVETHKNEEVLRVIWMYWPEQTTCANMNYPYRRELFLSDHCNCGDPPISTSEVLRQVKVRFQRNQKGDDFDFFVRQTYKTIDKNPCWITFDKSHLKCRCGAKEQEIEFRHGQTVLVTGLTTELLEPVIVLNKSSGDYYKARRFKRRKRDYRDAHARDNELVYSEELIWIKSRDIKRVCHIRRYSHEDVVHRRIPAPYSYNGTGDCWILTTVVSEAGNLKAISVHEMDMIEGFDPKEMTRVPLKGCSLFCGGGSFDRGFEESGAVEFTHSVDWAQPAIHTCRANAEDPDKLNLFYGNVNDWNYRLLKGDTSVVIPRVGCIGFMTAGSPCVAFSMLQPDKMSESSLRNASLVAALATAVDVLRPEYGVFENVFAMGSMCGDEKQENVLSQMICCFVGMGYQVQIVNQDAHSAGSGQQRSRLLICIAAPGLVPMTRPPMTHAHPQGTKKRVIGKAPNGESFGERIMDLTPFELNTAQDVIGDLPDIGDGMVNICIPFPDHRVSAMKRYQNWLKIKHIPRFPRGCSWTSAVAMGYMPKPIIDNIQRKSKLWNGVANKAYGRLFPDKSMPTVITVVTPDCAMNGKALHWDQSRVLTVMEARRAQSYPDHEVLIGLPSAQWRIAGNSVDRKVSVAAGVSLRQAWMSNDDYQPYIDRFGLGEEVIIMNGVEAVAVTIEKDIRSTDLELIASGGVSIKSVARHTASQELAITATRPAIFGEATRRVRAAVPMKAASLEPVRRATEPAVTKDVITRARPNVPTRAASPARMAFPMPDVSFIKPVATKKSNTAPIATAHPTDNSDLIVVKWKSNKRTSSGVRAQSTQAVTQSSRLSLPAKLSQDRSSARQSLEQGQQQPKIVKDIPRQSLPTKLVEQTRESRQSSADELGESLTTPSVPIAQRTSSANRSNPFAQYRARNRSPTTGLFLPRSVSATATSCSAQRLPNISTRQLPSAIRTNGMVSPPTTSEDQSPLLNEPSEVFETSFADIAQKPSPTADEDEDELSIHVDNALAATSTASLGLPDVSVKDVLEEHKEHANVSSNEQDIMVAQGSDWMDYELTG